LKNINFIIFTERIFIFLPKNNKIVLQIMLRPMRISHGTILFSCEYPVFFYYKLGYRRANAHKLHWYDSRFNV